MCMNNEETPFELTEPGFLTLFVRHELALRIYARTILPDWDLVDEALQEASVTMWQKRGQLEDAGGFLPWAKVILRFKCLRQLELLRARRPLLTEAMLNTLADREESRQQTSREREVAFQTCLDLFPEEHRELLLAPHRSTCSVVELARQRSRTANSLYKLLGRLREQLAGCIRGRTAAEAT